MDGIILARAVHVLAVVIWIGGVSMATTVMLPAVRRGALGPDPLAAFHAIEHRFVWQVRIMVLLVGATGFYMVSRLGLWSRFRDSDFWWMDAMLGVWLIFAILLFVIEPFVLHRRFARLAQANPARAFAWLHRAHVVLLALSLITILAAVAGSHGGSII